METFAKINFIITWLLIINHGIYSQSLYLLNFNDASTYGISCGTVNSTIWTVNNNNCSLTTSSIALPANPPAQTINAAVTIEGSGMDAGDKATIFYSVNGIWIIEKIINGQSGLFTSTHYFKIMANANSLISIRVNLSNNQNNERWRIYDGKIIIQENDPLPVEFVSFEGEKIQDGINLAWITASETANSFFTLERSDDGISFLKIAQVEGAGNSSTEKKYHYKDEEVKNGVNYYRLKQSDWDGNESYCARIISIDYSESVSAFVLFPNPLSDSELNLYADSEFKKEYAVTLIDETGKTIRSNAIEINKGHQTIILTGLFENLPPGAYIVTCTANKEFFQKKIIVR